ncbi:MAG: hypothetical protein A2060_04085 [Planctomycetes bacterium GWA2_50_13]|nr:MAG: hypothetical protein A2060_04085 [Planctomycetes bacterium GWA2_50_13]OHB95877.1 MAG: hypothetical protein A3I59_01860 [Planctomycetes bacterium RIFCSPLOWO2_02_FULL_50_16]OHC03342.1 MAG: hypothetical protein A3G17_00095 [Planctomycetes bacterium RIFCSPLOWO2_12_FULL_50_35]HCN19235.1 hypothetical protein [Planctomycetia bacterium]
MSSPAKKQANLINSILEQLAKELGLKSFTRVKPVSAPILPKAKLISGKDSNKTLKDPNYFPENFKLISLDTVYRVDGKTPIETQKDIKRFVDYILQKYRSARYTSKGIFEKACCELVKANPHFPKDIKDFLARPEINVAAPWWKRVKRYFVKHYIQFILAILGFIGSIAGPIIVFVIQKKLGD